MGEALPVNQMEVLVEVAKGVRVVAVVVELRFGNFHLVCRLAHSYTRPRRLERYCPSEHQLSSLKHQALSPRKVRLVTWLLAEHYVSSLELLAFSRLDLHGVRLCRLSCMHIELISLYS